MRPHAAPSSGNIVDETSLSTRFSVWFASIPLVTSCVLCVCCAVYVLCLLAGIDVFSYVCVQPVAMVQNLQVYRSLSSPFFHSGILHLAFNMLAFVPMGSALERQMGSFKLAHAVLLIAVAGSTIHAAAAMGAAYLGMWPALAMECAVGFSGVLFGLIVIETHLSPDTHRSLFGFFSIPSIYYPWALLILFQLLMSRVSLLGHLCGLLVGLAYSRGWLKWLTPSTEKVVMLESSRWMARVVNQPRFVMSGGGGGGRGEGLLGMHQQQHREAGQRRSVPPAHAWIAGLADKVWQRGSEGIAGIGQGQGAGVQGGGGGGGGGGGNVGGSSTGSGGTNTSNVDNSTFVGKGRTLGGGTGVSRLVGAGASSSNGALSSKVALSLPPPPPAKAQPLEQSTASVEATSATHSFASPYQMTAELAAGYEQLESMGFDPVQARGALLAAKGDLDAAVDILTSRNITTSSISNTR